jgi:hypothetical protein
MSRLESYISLKGKFTADQVQVTYTPTSNRLIDPSIEASLEKLWSQQLKAAEQKGMKLYDSEAYRLNSFQSSLGYLNLELAPVNYRTHAAMKSFYGNPQLTERYFDKTFVADSLIKANDGKYILGKVDKVVERATYLIGGTCAKSRVEIANALDLFEYARKRVSGILSIAESKVLADTLMGIIQNEIGCVHVIFDARVALSSNEIIAAFQPNNGVSELVVIDEVDITAYLARSEGYVAAVAGLL